MGRHDPGGDRVLCKEYGCDLQDTFRLIGRAIAVTRWFGIACALSGRVLVLRSVVAGSISTGGDHDIHCWWDLIRSKQLSGGSVCRVQVFAGFSGHVNSVYYNLSNLCARYLHCWNLTTDHSIKTKWYFLFICCIFQNKFLWSKLSACFRGAHSVMVIVVVNEHGVSSSNHRQSYLHFT